jgi:hypothetical protein
VDVPVSVALDDGEPGRVARRSFSMAMISDRFSEAVIAAVRRAHPGDLD